MSIGTSKLSPTPDIAKLNTGHASLFLSFFSGGIFSGVDILTRNSPIFFFSPGIRQNKKNHRNGVDFFDEFLDWRIFYTVGGWDRSIDPKKNRKGNMPSFFEFSPWSRGRQ